MKNAGSALQVLTEATIDRHHSIMAHQFAGRPTIVLLVICDRSQILLTQPRNDTHQRTWIPPQGDIRRGDRTLYGALLREGMEEIGLSEKEIMKKKMPVLGECLNPMPPERGLEYTHKQLFFIPVSVFRKDWVSLNEENIAHKWVTSPEHLLEVMAPVANERSVKFRATCEAINRAFKEKLLEWSFKPQHVPKYA